MLKVNKTQSTTTMVTLYKSLTCVRKDELQIKRANEMEEVFVFPSQILPRQDSSLHVCDHGPPSPSH